jgi:hypothetical protein
MQESEQSRFNFSFKNGQKNLNIRNETSIGIPIPLGRNFGNVNPQQSLADFGTLKLDKKSTS